MHMKITRRKNKVMVLNRNGQGQRLEGQQLLQNLIL